MEATKNDIEHLEKLYENRYAFHGELHDHADTGGTSDGACDLATWKKDMKKLNIDFAAILDHRQIRHMYLPEWDDSTFIAGTEPGTNILNVKNTKCRQMHYNMIFESPKHLENVLNKFKEFKFSGGIEGHFVYPSFFRGRFNKLINEVKAEGGFFVHPHPKQLMMSYDPLNYWTQDETGIEVFYGRMDSRDTEENYLLWTQLLALGKRVWACAGGDGHNRASDQALTTIYSQEKKNHYYLIHLRQGDFTCGPVGIRMCIGNTKMGGKCEFDNKRLVFCVSDFHNVVFNPEHKYYAYLYDDSKLVDSHEISCENKNYFAIDCNSECKYYRVEVFDVTQNLRIAIGNPIWNETFYK